MQARPGGELGKPTPAAANLEHTRTGRQGQFVQDALIFRLLGLLQGLSGVLTKQRARIGH